MKPKCSALSCPSSPTDISRTPDFSAALACLPIRSASSPSAVGTLFRCLWTWSTSPWFPSRLLFPCRVTGKAIDLKGIAAWLAGTHVRIPPRWPQTSTPQYPFSSLNGLIDVGNRHTEGLTHIVELLPQLFDDPLLVLLDDLVELGVIFSDFADLGFQGVVALDEYLAEWELAMLEGSNDELQILHEFIDLRNPFTFFFNIAWWFFKHFYVETLTRKSDCTWFAIEHAFSLALNGIVCQFVAVVFADIPSDLLALWDRLMVELSNLERRERSSFGGLQPHIHPVEIWLVAFLLSCSRPGLTFLLKEKESFLSGSVLDSIKAIWLK